MQKYQKYRLSLDNHEKKIMQQCRAYSVKGFYCDVTLACKGMSLQAHKVILAAGSSFFHSILLNHPDNHPVIVIKDMHFLDIQTILEFMYEGQTTFSEDQICELKRISDAFEIKDLIYLLKDFQSNNRESPSKSAHSNTRRRKRRRNTSALNNNNGGASESKADPEIECVNMIYKTSPSSPLENTDEPSSLVDQTTEEITKQSSRSPESITNSGNQELKFSPDRVIPEGMEPVELPAANRHIHHRIDVNEINENVSELVVISDSGSDTALSPKSPRRKQPSKQDVAIVPEEQVGVEPGKLKEKILTIDPTPILLKDKVLTEDPPAKQCLDKSFISPEFGMASSTIEAKNLTITDIPMSLEGEIPKEDQAAKHSTDEKSLTPYEIESSGPEGKDFSDDVNACVGQKIAAIADQQTERSSDTVQIDLDPSLPENFSLEITDKNYGKSLSIGNQEPECSPDDVYNAQVPKKNLDADINTEDEQPPAKRQKNNYENISDDGDDDDDDNNDYLHMKDNGEKDSDEDMVKKDDLNYRNELVQDKIRDECK